MRTFGTSSNIVIEGTYTEGPSPSLTPHPEQFEARVYRLLSQLTEFETGQIILNSIVRLQVRQVTLVPGARIDRCGARPVDLPAAGSGGHGSDVVIPFTTNVVSAAGQVVDLGDRAGASSSEVLLHELVHALHMMRGGWYRQPMGDGLEDREEFFSILLTNLYSSALHRPLRQNHMGFAELHASEASDYHLRYFFEIAALAEGEAGLGYAVFQQLSRVGSQFNPIRDYVAAQARLDTVSVSEWRRSPYLCRPVRPAFPSAIRSFTVDPAVRDRLRFVVRF